MKKLTLTLVLTLVLAPAAHAQQPSASHAQAIEELLQVTMFDKSMNLAIDVMIDSMIKADPQLKRGEDVMRRFFNKYMSLKYLKPELVQLYAEIFTESEVRELIAFNRTPLGQKMLTQAPELMQKGAALGQKAVQEHLPELQEAIAKKIQQRGSPD